MLFYTHYQPRKDRVTVTLTKTGPIVFVYPLRPDLVGIQTHHERAARSYLRSARPTWNNCRLAGQWLHKRNQWLGMARWMNINTTTTVYKKGD
jgi:hypothetical protein